MSAVSMKVTPRSIARWMISEVAAASALPPNVLVPRPIAETFSPELPEPSQLHGGLCSERRRISLPGGAPRENSSRAECPVDAPRATEPSYGTGCPPGRSGAAGSPGQTPSAGPARSVRLRSPACWMAEPARAGDPARSGARARGPSSRRRTAGGASSDRAPGAARSSPG